MASLDSPITKYNRAEEHVQTLRQHLSPLRDLNSYVIASHIDSETGDQIRRFDQVPPMPDGLDVLLGEMLYNFRCSLDHLVWQLVLSEGNTSTTRNEFPIFLDSARYEAEKGSKLQGVSNTVVTIIDRLQPCYSTGPDDYWSHLWELQVLSNTDKHRHLLLTLRTLGQLYVSGQFESIPRAHYLAVPVEVGAVFFRGEPNVNMNVQPTIQVLFSNAPSDIRQDLPVENIIGLISGSVGEAFGRLRHHVK